MPPFYGYKDLFLSAGRLTEVVGQLHSHPQSLTNLSQNYVTTDNSIVGNFVPTKLKQ